MHHFPYKIVFQSGPRGTYTLATLKAVTTGDSGRLEATYEHDYTDLDHRPTELGQKARFTSKGVTETKPEKIALDLAQRARGLLAVPVKLDAHTR